MKVFVLSCAEHACRIAALTRHPHTLCIRLDCTACNQKRQSSFRHCVSIVVQLGYFQNLRKQASLLLSSCWIWQWPVACGELCQVLYVGDKWPVYHRASSRRQGAISATWRYHQVEYLQLFGHVSSILMSQRPQTPGDQRGSADMSSCFSCNLLGITWSIMHPLARHPVKTLGSPKEHLQSVFQKPSVFTLMLTRYYIHP